MTCVIFAYNQRGLIRSEIQMPAMYHKVRICCGWTDCQCYLSEYWQADCGGRTVRAGEGQVCCKTNLAQQLTLEFGPGFSYRSLNEYRRFYLSFNDLEIMHTRVHNLTWNHLRIIMCETTPEGRLWSMEDDIRTDVEHTHLGA